MPDLSAYTQDDADLCHQQFRTEGRCISEEYNDSVAKGYVTWQGVDAGSEVAEGTVVNFGVSKGPRETETEAPSNGQASVYHAGR